MGDRGGRCAEQFKLCLFHGICFCSRPLSLLSFYLSSLLSLLSQSVALFHTLGYYYTRTHTHTHTHTHKQAPTHPHTHPAHAHSRPHMCQLKGSQGRAA